jgi:hypothetical protein
LFSCRERQTLWRHAKNRFQFSGDDIEKRGQDNCPQVRRRGEIRAVILAWIGLPLFYKHSSKWTTNLAAAESPFFQGNGSVDGQRQADSPLHFVTGDADILQHVVVEVAKGCNPPLGLPVPRHAAKERNNAKFTLGNGLIQHIVSHGIILQNAKKTIFLGSEPPESGSKITLVMVSI